jgi:proteasome lid subunit RPN8/RPN11
VAREKGEGRRDKAEGKRQNVIETVTLADGVRAAIVAHARREAPRECCGLLVGCGLLVDACEPVPNVSPTPFTRYAIDPATHIATRRRLRGTGREVIGCYHSHPAAPAIPSETDLADAYYPEFVWIIVSLANAVRPDLAAFRLTHGQYTPLHVAIEPDRPSP